MRRRSLVLLLIWFIVPTTSTSTCGDASPAASGHKLLQRATQLGVEASSSPSVISLGGPGCPCIGLDQLSGTVKSPSKNSTSEAYPASIGAHCDIWDKSCRSKSDASCWTAQESWCFVDPCNCNASSRQHPKWQGLLWQGHPVYASAATCTSNQSVKEGGPLLSACNANQFQKDLMGNAKCKCIGIVGLSGDLRVNISNQQFRFPADLGSSCQSWDDGRHPDCRKAEQPGWCHRQWCYVDPCTCNIEELPKVSTYFPRANYRKKALYYSYEACHSFDTFTYDSHSACVNQETEAKCLALGGDPDDPKIRKCAWGGPEIKCLGKELLHVCQVSDETLSDWSWWLFNRESSDDARTSNIAFAVLGLPGLRGFPRPATCALLPPPRSNQLARTPSTSSDRWQQSSSVSLLQEPVERPLSRYLHKEDSYYNRVVPDWDLQIKTLEQQYLYEGDFSLLIKEVTEEGAIVQDVTTGVFGFLPEANFGSFGTDVLAGDVVNGAKCTYLDNTIIQSPDPSVLRLQTGVVFEWDEAAGEGFIIPSEEQDAFNMIRALRRDIRWHDSRRLFPGQFVQFETALPHEVPVTSEENPRAPLALRVRGLEVRFSLEDAYELIPEGAAEPLVLEADKAPYKLPEISEADHGDDGDGRSLTDLKDVSHSAMDIAKKEMAAQRDAFPVSPARPELASKKKVHPLLQRFAEEEPLLAEAESPSWMWQPHLEYLKEERYDPIMPIQLRKMPVKPKRIRILSHEVALERGDTWQEAAQRRGLRLWEKQKPPGRKQQEYLSQKLHLEKTRAKAERIRRRKLELAAFEKQQKRPWRA